MENIEFFGLTSKQKEMVRQLIKDQCYMLSGGDDDVEDIRSHPMKINLKDGHPLHAVEL